MKFWWVYAVLGAVFGGVMPVLVKRGLLMPDGKTIDSNLATAVRVVMLIVPVWALVWYQGSSGQMGKFSGMNWLFLALSAVATGLSWLFSFKALQYADASRVMPIDKFSLVVTVIMGVMFLGEVITWRLVAAVGLIVAGTFLAMNKSEAKGKDEGKEKKAESSQVEQQTAEGKGR